MGQAVASERDLVESLLFSSATRAERAFSAVRVVTCTGLIIRYLIIHDFPFAHWEPESWVDPIILCVPLVFGLFVFARSAQSTLSTRVLYASVLIDAIVCSASLATCVFWAPPGYHGIFQTPDISALCFMIFATNFRVFPRMIVVGACANILFAVGLLLLDLHLNAAVVSHWREAASIQLIFLLASSGIAYITMRRTYDLVYTGAEKARQAERTQQSMAYLLREQHDARSLVGALEMSADRLAGVLGNSTDDNVPLLQNLQFALRDLHHHVVSARDRAYLELASLDVPQATNLPAALSATIERLKQRVPQVQVEVGMIVDQPIMLRGGQSTLQHLVLNLLVNAAEGDGRVGARSVQIHAFASDGGQQVTLVVEDDGPGFPARILARQGEEPATSEKPGSSGMGLWLVQRVLRRSGGEALYQNRDGGGARVLLTFSSDILDVAAPASKVRWRPSKRLGKSSMEA